MITDLFSHKLHSSDDDWPEKLTEIAAIFGEFDGKLYDRNAFEERLKRISPRASYLAQEYRGTSTRSSIRDEISIYPTLLGLYYLEQSSSGWVVRVTETTKKFLLKEEPDVASFLRLQLSLLQYPNAMGAVYKDRTNHVRVQHNAKTLEYISDGYHLSPLRLIAVALKADAHLKGVDVSNASVTFEEIYGLANHPSININALPGIQEVVSGLNEVRNDSSLIPSKIEKRFHTLRHTEMFDVDMTDKTVKLRAALSN